VKAKNLLYLVWLIPAYLLFLLIHQIDVFFDARYTIKNGELYVAEVTDFRIKQIAAQTNGYIDVRFTTTQGDIVERRLSLAVQHAARLMEEKELQVRYLAGSGQEIVIVPTFNIQQQIVRINIAIIVISFTVMLLVSLWAMRFLKGRKEAGTDVKPEFEIINTG
jgi:hypothetical protein